MTVRAAARFAAVLFVATGVLFAVGVSVESDDHQESPATETVPHDEEAEAPEAREGEEADDEGGEAEASGHDESGEEEKVLGVDVESPATVALALLVSAALAVGLWFRPLRPVAIGALAAGLAFAVFDVAEVAQQLDESNSGLAVLAGLVATGHVAAAVASGRVAWRQS